MPGIRQNDASPIIPGSPARRPPPPPELDKREAAIWRKITGCLPPDWFAASAPLLVELTRHICIADDLTGDIARARAAIDEIRQRPEPPLKLLIEAMKEYRALLRDHGLQSQRIGALSTKLRLTPQSRYARSTAHVVAAEATSSYPDPWSDWGDRAEPSGPNGRKLKQ